MARWYRVSMHLLVLSAFRLKRGSPQRCPPRVSMHLLVLSAFRRASRTRRPSLVLVSMHLLVLSAFRLYKPVDNSISMLVSMHLLVLSAFRPMSPRLGWVTCKVSMHLLVLSAFRRRNVCWHNQWSARLNAPFGAQCFPTRYCGSHWTLPSVSQCTFWCSVLSDRLDSCRTRRLCGVSMHLLVLSAFRLSCF